MPDQAEKLREMMKDRDKVSSGNGSDPEVAVRANSSGTPAPHGAAEGKRTRIIAVSSGKGGVGKTNVATNLAIAYAKLGKRVIVLDADLGAANVNVVLGVIPKYNLYHLIRNQKTMKDILLDTRYGIQIVAGASGFSKIANLSADERDRFVAELQELSNADIIVIDTSAGVSDNVLAFVAAADDALIVTTPEPTAITDAYGIIKIIATDLDELDLGLKLIVNRVHSVTEAKKVAERVISIAGQFLNLKVDYLGYVYEDQSVPNSVLKQKPFMVADPRGRASICINHLVARLENVEYREGRGVARFLGRLFGGA